MAKKCLKCGEYEAAIRKDGLICGEVSYCGELVAEYGRHRFKPWTPKEQAKMDADEKECAKQMGEMADFVMNQMKTTLTTTP